MKYHYACLVSISTACFGLELELAQSNTPLMSFKAEIKYTTEQNKIYEALVFKALYEIVNVRNQFGIVIKNLESVRDEKHADILRPSALYLICQHAKLQNSDITFIMQGDDIKNFNTIKEKRIPAGWKQGSIKIQKVLPRWIS